MTNRQRTSEALHSWGYERNLPPAAGLRTVEVVDPDDNRPDNREDIREFLATRRARLT